ncbi:MAG: lysostaphin resistance A-like protein [Chitinophagaceae bacterium]
MQSYLKYKPVWVQLLLFLGMALGIFTVLSFIGIAILSNVTGISILEVSDPSKWDIGKPAMITFIRGMLAIQFIGLFVIPSLLFAYFSDPQSKQYIGLLPPSNNVYWILGIAALLLAIPLVEYIGLMNKQISLGEGTNKWMEEMEEDTAKAIQFMLSKNTPGNLILNIIFVALFAGIGEELFFRGVLQRLFIKGFKNAWAGIIMAAFFFSFFHFQFFGFFPRLLLGILLGAVYWYSGSLWTAILAHFIYDAFFIILIYFQPHLLNTEATLFKGPATITLALISAVILALLVWWMKRKSLVTYKTVYNNDIPEPSARDFTFDR